MFCYCNKKYHKWWIYNDDWPLSSHNKTVNFVPSFEVGLGQEHDDFSGLEGDTLYIQVESIIPK